MKRRTILGAGLVAAMGLALSGCTGFAPVYGDASPSGLGSARFNFAPPTNRTEQLILSRLQIAFPNPAGPTDPTLTVSASVSGLSGPMSNAMAVATPVSFRVEGTVTITQDDKTLFTARRFTDSAFQSGKLTPTDLASSAGASEMAAQSTAESLRAAILAGYRPGMVVSTPQR